MSLYETYLIAHPQMSNGDLADLILQQEDLSIDRKSVLRGLQRARSCSEVKIVGSGRRGDSYTIGEEYEFLFDDYSFDIPKDEIAAAVSWYCDPNGLTLNECCNRLWVFYKRHIDEDYLRRVFACLGITKSSNGLAPHIIAEWSEEQISDFFIKVRRDKVDRKLTDGDAYRALYEAERKKTLSIENFMAGIRSALERDIGLREPQPPLQMPILDEYERVIVLSDWHIGQKSDYFNFEIAQQYVENLKSEILGEFSNRPYLPDRIHILCLGDMIDGALGNMRAEQSLQQDLHAEEQIVACARLLADVVNFVRDISNVDVVCHAVGGNHGRLGPSRHDDPTRLGDKMVYLLAESLSNDGIQWELYSKVMNHFMCKSTQVLFHHGDRAGNDIKNIVWANKLDEAVSFVVCTGHLHSIKIEEVHRGVYHFRVGSFPSCDDYASSHGWSARPSQIMFDIYDDGPRLPIYLTMS